ncbi:hypothetical protein [Acidisphaera sp. S103]|uniref:hypothetical protein n=1 Tax=Acidisphaera sp. S103 TaxID=1747223 RepID=UPI00131BCF97|nr:hypothetical protein [Acidisphaera sp. S103]
MSDNPLDKIPAHNRISIRAVLVHEGEDAAANGIPKEEILETENLVAMTSNFKDSGRMDNVYTHLPVSNVQNIDLGYQLHQSGEFIAKSKP